MKSVRINVCLLSSLLLASPVAFAKGDAAAGLQKSQVCQACHGSDGRGTNPTYPVLAGQHESYLAQSLASYRDGTRTNAVMAGMAANLSDQDIADLAAYYAAMAGLKDLSIK
jgi:cytochrome c553